MITLIQNSISAQNDTTRADKIHNCTVRTLERLRACVDMTNMIISRGDKTTIVAALDPEIVTIVEAIAALVTTHTADPVVTNLI
jgi:hypothetical protein